MPTFHENSGFTLVELLAALVISMVGILGLLQVVSVATEQNVRNTLRDEAGRLAEQQLGSLVARPYASISSTQQTIAATAQLRGGSKPFTITWQGTDISVTGTSVTATKDVGVRVSWAYKNMTTAHEVHTIRACGQSQDSCP